jgi:hypothetical protein
LPAAATQILTSWRKKCGNSARFPLRTGENSVIVRAIAAALGEAFGPKRGRARVAQPVTAILSSHAELAAKARAFTGDANEAGLLVGKVVSRAFSTFKGEAAYDVVLHAMQRDLDAMIEKLRRAKL